MEEAFSHGFEEGACALEGFRFAANHEDEFTLFCAPGAAGDGGVEKVDAALGAVRGDAARESRRDGARIDEQAAALEAAENAIRAPENGFERGRVADDGDGNVGALGNFAGRSSHGGA